MTDEARAEQPKEWEQIAQAAWKAAEKLVGQKTERGYSLVKSSAKKAKAKKKT